MPSKPAHRPPHAPSEKDRIMVKTMVAGGIEQGAIAAVLGISKPTLRKHYKREIETAAAEAHMRVNASLFQQATKGNITAIIWWDKTRRGMSETQKVENTGPDGGAIIHRIERVIIDPKN